MLAVLLFSAVIHIATVALATTLILQLWMEKRGRPDIAPSEFARMAGIFGVGLGVFATVLMWTFHPFGQALVIGIAVGVLAAAMLIVFADVRLLATSPAGKPWHQRPQSLLFCGTFACLQLVAFLMLVTQLGNARTMG